VGIDRRWIHLERAGRERDGLRRVVVGEGASGADHRRHPAGIGLQRHLERFQRFGVVVLLEEQLAPRRLNRAIAGRAARVAVRGVGFVKRPSARSARPARATPSDRRWCRPAARPSRGSPRVGTAEHLLQQPEFERRFARRRARATGAAAPRPARSGRARSPRAP
jgi:hypothetical protein